MARYSAVADAVVTGTALKTMMQVAAGAADRFTLISLDVTFDGVTATAVPVLVSIQRQTSAGTGGTSVTQRNLDPADGTSASTVLKGPAGTWTGEPTAGDILQQWRVPPTSGFSIQYPLGREIITALSGRLALVVTAAATVNCTVTMTWEE